MPGTAARTLACAAELLARFLKLRYEGIAIASRIPRMMMTTSSSIRVKPLSSLARRLRGEMVRLEERGKLMPDDTQQLLYRVLSSEQQKRLEVDRQLDLSHAVPGLARFRVNVYFQRESLGAAFRLIPEQLKTLEELH